MIGIDDWAWKRSQRYGTLVCEPRVRIPMMPDTGVPASTQSLNRPPSLGEEIRAAPCLRSERPAEDGPQKSDPDYSRRGNRHEQALAGRERRLVCDATDDGRFPDPH
jgi:hypothetical protein